VVGFDQTGGCVKGVGSRSHIGIDLWHSRRGLIVSETELYVLVKHDHEGPESPATYSS
jgi:hypothetical protein